MPESGPYPKTCPKCGAEGEAIKATTAKGENVVIDLKCTRCEHAWTETLKRPM